MGFLDSGGEIFFFFFFFFFFFLLFQDTLTWEEVVLVIDYIKRHGCKQVRSFELVLAFCFFF
jgi:hypothetical protein